MNAIQQITSLEMMSKVEAIVYSFRKRFPESLADLKPWINNTETQQFNDPDSVDIGFYFPNLNSSCQCRTILMQVKIQRDADHQECKVLGIQLSGYEAYREQWQFSTIGHWSFSGTSIPTADAQDLLKKVCCQILQLFNSSEISQKKSH